MNARDLNALIALINISVILETKSYLYGKKSNYDHYSTSHTLYGKNARYLTIMCEYSMENKCTHTQTHARREGYMSYMWIYNLYVDIQAI